MAGFKPQEHMTDLKGKDYLEVKWRLVWFREQHPAGAITTELIATEPNVIIRASVHASDGVILATGYGTAPAGGKGTWTGRSVEKAETAAIGRALAHAGYGTQFDGDDDTDNLADTPIERPAPSAAANGWTREQHNSLALVAKQNEIGPDELLRVLDVKKVSDFAPGFSVAHEQLRKYIDARPMVDTAPAIDLFAGDAD